MTDVTHTETPEITIRAARPGDRAEIARVAGRDTNALPEGRLLVAEVNSHVRAAISIDGGEIVADPFHRTVELVQMLKIRAGAVRHTRGRGVARSRSGHRSAPTLSRAA